MKNGFKAGTYYRGKRDGIFVDPILCIASGNRSAVFELNHGSFSVKQHIRIIDYEEVNGSRSLRQRLYSWLNSKRPKPIWRG